MPQLNPYLSFNDNCREAMTFYHDCFGGELTLQSVGDSPVASQMPPGLQNQILHGVLTIGQITIMGSDLRKSKLLEGNTVQLCLQCESEAETDSLFTKLSAGGQVTETLQDMFWGGKSGTLTDKFGKKWIFNYDKSGSKT